MSEIHVESGSPLPLKLVGNASDTGLFPQAHVFVRGTDIEVAGSPFNLSALTLARYVNNSVTVSAGKYYAVYRAYSDVGHSSEVTRIGRPTDYFSVDSRLADISAIKAKTGLLAFTAGNVHADVKVNSDKTGYALTAAEKAAIIDGVWDEAFADHLAAGSTGAQIARIDDIETKVDSISSTLGSAVVHQVMMTTAIDEDADEITFDVWLMTNGLQQENTTEASLDVRNSDGSVAFTISATTTQTKGVFELKRASASTVVEAGKTFIAHITIKRGAETFNAAKPFTVY